MKRPHGATKRQQVDREMEELRSMIDDEAGHQGIVSALEQQIDGCHIRWRKWTKALCILFAGVQTLYLIGRCFGASRLPNFLAAFSRHPLVLERSWKASLLLVLGPPFTLAPIFALRASNLGGLQLAPTSAALALYSLLWVVLAQGFQAASVPMLAPFLPTIVAWSMAYFVCQAERTDYRQLGEVQDLIDPNKQKGA